jgi:hypothetical protein
MPVATTPLVHELGLLTDSLPEQSSSSLRPYFVAYGRRDAPPSG